MNYKVSSIPLFDRQAKRLARKYPSFKIELSELIQSLVIEPEQGKALGNNFYKVRLAISSKGKGKSGGARVITYLTVTVTTVYLTAIYDKSEKDSISDIELDQIFKSVP